MASWTTREFVNLLAVVSALLTCICASGKNDWHFPTCVVTDENDGSCLNVFLRSSTGLQSVRYNGNVVNHQWVRYLDHVYDYNDEEEQNCKIRRRSKNHEAYINFTWTQDGFSTCEYEEITQFNDWWTSICTQEYCGEDTNCFRYATYLGYHLWNNCRWNDNDDRPDYDIRVP